MLSVFLPRSCGCLARPSQLMARSLRGGGVVARGLPMARPNDWRHNTSPGEGGGCDGSTAHDLIDGSVVASGITNGWFEYSYLIRYVCHILYFEFEI
jgi:hypothetical protein